MILLLPLALSLASSSSGMAEVFGASRMSRPPRPLRLVTVGVVGGSGVGKSTLVAAWKECTPFRVQPRPLPTLGNSMEILKISKTLRLRIFDLSGNPRYRSILKTILHYLEAILFVYRASNRASFTNLVSEWCEQLPTKPGHCMLLALVDDSNPRCVSRHEGFQLAAKFDMAYCELDVIRARADETRLPLFLLVRDYMDSVLDATF